MKTTNNILSETRLKRLRAQGYTNVNDEELSDMAFGIRFAYRTCVAIIVAAILFQSIEIFTGMLIIAFLGIVLPNHPFDYIYNAILSKTMNKPKVPARAVQLKFACTIATIWLAAVVYLMYTGNITSALILGGLLAITASLPSTIDFCVPSAIYNNLLTKNLNSVMKSTCKNNS